MNDKDKTLEPIYDTLGQRLMYRDSDSNKLLTRAEVYQLIHDDIASSAAENAIIYAHPVIDEKVVVVTPNDLIVEKYDAEKFDKVVDDENVLLYDETSGSALDADELFSMIRSEVENELDPRIQFKKRVKTIDVVSNGSNKMFEVYDMKHKTIAFVDDDNELMSWNDVSKMYNHKVDLADEVQKRGSMIVAEGGSSKDVVRFDVTDKGLLAQRFEGKHGLSYAYGKGSIIKKDEVNEILDRNQKKTSLKNNDTLNSIIHFKPKGLGLNEKKVPLVDVDILKQKKVYGLTPPIKKEPTVIDENDNESVLEY